ncbi:MAG TPA: N,N-dimethylformamidase beta subunit family domain-containing protein [Geminicoccaceae bacterium]|nr:N,N-dimethylformamidase beta subunit family domain-containing protein [Geminicoccaceae bacterium]
MKVLGYCDRLSVAPGETVRFMVSCTGATSYRAEVVRIIHGDANPAGPGLKLRKVPAPVDGEYPAREQRIDAGSYLRVPDHPRLRTLQGFTVMAMIWPTTPARGRQGLVAKWAPAGGAGFALEIQGGELALTLGDGRGGGATVRSGKRLLRRRWYLVAASFDPGEGLVTLVQRPLAPAALTDDEAMVSETVALVPTMPEGPLLMAGLPQADGRVEAHYNGKLDSPALFERALEPAELDAALLRPLPAWLRRHVVGAWDFAVAIPTTRAVDRGPLGLDGELLNLPARAMKGWNWTGEALRWTERPEHYGAVHFHEDDLYDAGWQADFALTVPDSFQSGAYAAHVWCGGAEDGTEEDYITFFVRPPRGPAGKVGRPTAAFRVPTASYLAYANDHNHLDAENAEMLMGRLLVYQQGDLYLQEHRELGYSLYDTHADGSGVCYSSQLRPILNLRPKYSSWLGAHGSGLWQFNADTHLIDWLEHEGIAVDFVTDHDLEAEGVALLEPYRVVLTGTHPEYHSKRMSDAMLAWQEQGGRLMYLGANGWYWRIAWHADLPGVIEVRRAEDGIRTWAAEPGEYHHSFTGEFGGLWRRNGRPPNVVVGLGFSAQGFDLSSYYRRRPSSHDPRAAFIFEGVGDEVIGDFGLVGGGAAGLELDRADFALGTPPNLLVLASSENHTDLVLVVNEEVNVMTPDLSGSQNELVRADLAFYETPAGGAVFSTGSIAWCGSLSHNNYDNNVARITSNVLRRFLDPTPFEV